MEPQQLSPDYIFEVSWEVCNKIGGIYTVLATKAKITEQHWHERLVFIGPDVWKGDDPHPEFTEDHTLFSQWRLHAEQEGLKVKIGRWHIPGNPVVILVDFSPFLLKKNEIFSNLWITYQLDSLTGNWDYIEPAIFGYAAGKVIECFYRYHINYTDKVVAQFHEWMTGTGILYLETYAPQVATILTAHATVLGRALAGTGLPFYSNLDRYIPEEAAKQHNVISKHSLEKVSAANADCFTTVSQVTAVECQKFLNKKPDIITPNGFDNSIVPGKEVFQAKRQAARSKILRVAEALLNQAFPHDTLLVIKSGRYEFHNKGIDVFIKSLAEINKHTPAAKTILAVIFVPGHHTGARKELLERMEHTDYTKPVESEWLTHNLQHADSDIILKYIRQNDLNNRPADNVKILFVPTYVDGNDGIFNLHYYDLLVGFDLAVFPSYYEPWGYTPLESIAFHIPAVTTDITGFGKAVVAVGGATNGGIYIVERNDYNESEVIKNVAGIICDFSRKTETEINACREAASNLSTHFTWERQISYYLDAYSMALEKSVQREGLYRQKPQAEPAALPEAGESKPLWRQITVQMELPERLKDLYAISMNLWWCWNEEAISVFEYIDNKLWQACHNNPIIFLRSLSYPAIRKLEKDSIFEEKLAKVHTRLNDYLNKPLQGPAVAYFSMEYGLHNTLKLYSGGLGVLAGDYLKEASDRAINITGIGLLYKNGYFRQRLSVGGDQLQEAEELNFSLLPLQLVCNHDGKPLKISIPFPGRRVIIQVWKLSVGRVPLYFLDSLLPENSNDDQKITAQLYAAEEELRLQQEIILGIGGILALNAMKIQPGVYHCNEGHAAFIGLARLYDLIQTENLSFDEAIEVLRSSTLFTTHTSVPAAIDRFSEALLRPYFAHLAQHFDISWERLMTLGKIKAPDREEKFSMAYMACRLSQEINAVSRMHKAVSCELFNVLWKNYQPDELHIGYVTNGVHYDTWVAREWKQLYQRLFGTGFADDMSNPVYWEKIKQASDSEIWEIRKKLKKDLLSAISTRVASDMETRHENPNKIEEALSGLNERAFIIGFARRVTAYKRPDLLLSDATRLAKILCNNDRPALLLVSGKAHPNDMEGLNIIKNLAQAANQEVFKHRILFLEDYDINLAKLLVQGVDLWLNTPNRHTEASGTSGMKALMNGVLNFSVMDGWWDEAYIPEAGWALSSEAMYKNQGFQDELDAAHIFQCLENEIIPLYFTRGKDNIPEGWIHYMKNSIAISSRYTMSRVLDEYNTRYYNVLYQRNRLITADGFSLAKTIAAWKKKIRQSWNQIDVISIKEPDRIEGQTKMPFTIRVVLDISDFSVNEVGLEIVLRTKGGLPTNIPTFTKELNVIAKDESRISYECQVPELQSGTYEYGFRIFPKNTDLPYRQDIDIVTWV